MSSYTKMRKRRDNWKRKAVTAKADLRYERKEKKRIKGERDKYKKETCRYEQELRGFKQHNKPIIVFQKTDLVFLVLQFFTIARIGFRAISRVLDVLAPQLGLKKTPCTQTIINWVTRLSIVRMKDVMPFGGVKKCTPMFSHGFILILDASIGLGKGKILTILALDAKHHSLNPGAPSLQNIKCVSVSVADTWTGETIAVLLEKVITQIGRPVAYLKDGGTDLGKAVRLLDEKGLPSMSIDDISHFAANLLKHEYQKHPKFDVFIRACGKVSKMFKQTILACLAPPKVSTKARFMNLHRLVKWASLLLEHSSKGRAAKGSVLQKLRDCFDQLPQCRTFICEFLRDAEPLLECQRILKQKGLSQRSFDECLPIINTIPNSYIHNGFMNWLETHLSVAKTLGLHEIGMPTSSDSIESLFGVAKHHGTGEIRDANRIALRIPTLCGTLTRHDAEEVIKITVKEEREWSGFLPSLIKQRRNVLPRSGSLEKIAIDSDRQNLELIAGSKTGQNAPIKDDKTIGYRNRGDP